MSKMTTEQFLSQLGIEIGKPFRIDGDERFNYKIVGNEVCFDGSDTCQYYLFYPQRLNWLLDKEITPLPKYTLTDDEKNFVKITTIKWLMRKFGYLINGGNELELYIDNSLFPFIKNDEKIDIDELRKCL